MPFQIINADTGAFVESTASFSPLQFETGEAAQAYCKTLARDTGGKYRVKRVLDHQWTYREQAKFDNGTYQPVTWSRMSWWRTAEANNIWAHHFVHISKKEPGMVAYTESAEQGMDNKKTRMKPGRYLEKHFSDMCHRFGISIEQLAKEFAKATEPKEVFFAKTEDEIQWVYEHGPASCMSSKQYRKDHGWGYPEPGKWPDDYHACRVYAAGDLEVAYLRDVDKNPKSRVIARALVWPAKLTHSRCYGDEVRLKTMLGAMGYRAAAPVGAKILRKPFNRQFIVPYIDQGHRSGSGSLALKDMKDHLLIVEQATGTYPANSTSGLSGNRYNSDGSQDDGAGVCGRCNTGAVDPGDVAINTRRVFTGAAGGDYQHWCDHCVEGRGVQCAADGRWYNGETMEMVQMGNGERWAIHNFRQYGFKCHVTGENWSTDYCTRVYTGDGDKQVKIYREALRDHAFQCRYTGNWFMNDQKVVMNGGDIWSKLGLKHAGFHCTGCNKNYHVAHRSYDSKDTCKFCKPTGERAPKKPEPVQPAPELNVVSVDEANQPMQYTRVDPFANFAQMEQHITDNFDLSEEARRMYDQMVRGMYNDVERVTREDRRARAEQYLRAYGGGGEAINQIVRGGGSGGGGNGAVDDNRFNDQMHYFTEPGVWTRPGRVTLPITVGQAEATPDDIDNLLNQLVEPPANPER